MVKRVEGFETEFERLAFGKSCHLVESNVEIVDARPVEEVPFSIGVNRAVLKYGSPLRGLWLICGLPGV
jgi:hypothetical protein